MNVGAMWEFVLGALLDVTVCAMLL